MAATALNLAIFQTGNKGECRSVTARYGGEEFVGVLPGLDGESALAAAQNIGKVVAQAGTAHAWASRSGPHFLLAILSSGRTFLWSHVLLAARSSGRTLAAVLVTAWKRPQFSKTQNIFRLP